MQEHRRGQRSAQPRLSASPGVRGGAAVLGLVLASVAAFGAGTPAFARDAGLHSAMDRAGELVQLAAQEDDLADDLEELEAWLAEAREALAELTAELAEAEAELHVLEAQLGIAEMALDDAEERAERASERSAEADRELREAEAELDEREELLHAQLARAYMYGDTTQLQMLDALLAQERGRDVVTGLYHLAQIVEHEHDNVVRLAELHEEALRVRARADAARHRADDEVAAAERTREAVADLQAEQERVLEVVEEREAAQAALVEEIESDRDEAAALLDEVRDEVDAARAELGDGDLVCPVPGGSFIDDWHFPRSGGRLHEGNDVFADRGAPVLAVGDGVVQRVNRSDTWSPGSSRGLGGRTVSIVTDDGVRWYYAHLDEVADGLAPGVAVTAGDRLGTVGTSGNARYTPPHLHLGRYVGGTAENPYPFIDPACR